MLLRRNLFIFAQLKKQYGTEQTNQDAGGKLRIFWER